MEVERLIWSYFPFRASHDSLCFFNLKYYDTMKDAKFANSHTMVMQVILLHNDLIGTIRVLLRELEEVLNNAQRRVEKS